MQEIPMDFGITNLEMEITGNLQQSRKGTDPDMSCNIC
jgi:hypothetical protein